MNDLINKIEHDIKVNERCLEEETDFFVKVLLELWNKYDKELLEIINKLKMEENK